MRFRLAVLVAVTSVLTVVSPATAGPSAPSEHSAAGDWAYVHRQLFDVSLRQFIGTATSGDRWYDWTSDGCSAPLIGNTGLSFNFRDPCRRHDFGYRNITMLERRYGRGAAFWNHANRRAVDQQFLSDMRAHCRTRSILLRPSCFTWAQAFYAAVRIAGGP